MDKLLKENWDEYNILQRVLDGQTPELHFEGILCLYEKYRFGDWNRKIPKPESFCDKAYLLEADNSYCLFHQVHKKFGRHILECADSNNYLSFVFFDYSILQSAFASLDNKEQLPYIPTYYAFPEDRYDYQNGSHNW